MVFTKPMTGGKELFIKCMKV